MPTRKALKKDIGRRIGRVHEMMGRLDIGALIIVGSAAPGGVGALRYISNAHVWGGATYGVLGRHDPDPWVMTVTPYQALWTRNETTTDPDRVEAPDDMIGRVVELAREYAGPKGRVGVVNLTRLLSVGAHTQLSTALSGHELVEVTGAYNGIRQIKTPFELEAIQQNGAILDAAMDVFREHAHVGARYWDVCAATEAFIKGHGAFWGRTKLSLDITPYTIPTPKDLRMEEDDIINFEIVYESPWGYWLEMTSPGPQASGSRFRSADADDQFRRMWFSPS